jgi:hypothetical protein
MLPGSGAVRGNGKENRAQHENKHVSEVLLLKERQPETGRQVKIIEQSKKGNTPKQGTLKQPHRRMLEPPQTRKSFELRYGVDFWIALY